MFRRWLIGMSVLLTSLYVLATVNAADALTLVLPSLGRVEGSLLLLETFDSEQAWEQYSSPRGVELGVENGVYRAYTGNSGYVWGLNQLEHSDVILEVDVTPLTSHYENGFGVMCRADTSNNGDGYYFMLTG